MARVLYYWGWFWAAFTLFGGLYALL